MITIGRIVSHPCGQKAVAACSRCEQPCCKQHMSTQSDFYGQCCICSGEYQPPKAPLRVTLKDMFEFESEDFAAFDRDQGATWSIGPYDS